MEIETRNTDTFAHFYKASYGCELIISRTPALNTGIISTQAVSGKREARKIAEEIGAKCWNF